MRHTLEGKRVIKDNKKE